MNEEGQHPLPSGRSINIW